MPPILIDPETLRTISRLMDQDIRLILDEEFHLQQAASQLDMAWQGGDSSEFINDLLGLQRQLHEHIKNYYSLSRQLSHEADRWEENDQTWEREYQNMLARPWKAGK